MFSRTINPFTIRVYHGSWLECILEPELPLEYTSFLSFYVHRQLWSWKWIAIKLKYLLIIISWLTSHDASSFYVELKWSLVPYHLLASISYHHVFLLKHDNDSPNKSTHIKTKQNQCYSYFIYFYFLTNFLNQIKNLCLYTKFLQEEFG